MRSHEGVVALFASLWASARLGVIMLGALVLTVALGVYITWPLIQTNLTPTQEIAFTGIDAKEKTTRESRADATLRSAGERLVNRSPFYPLKPQAPEVPRNLPRTYGGPTLIAIYGDTAFFDDSTRLRVGAATLGDVQVLALNPPWSAKVRWRGGEFTVTLFERPENVLNSGGFTRDPFAPARAPATSRSPASPSSAALVAGPVPSASPMPSPPIGPPPTLDPADAPDAPPGPPPAPPPDGGPPIAALPSDVNEVEFVSPSTVVATRLAVLRVMTTPEQTASSSTKTLSQHIQSALMPISTPRTRLGE